MNHFPSFARVLPVLVLTVSTALAQPQSTPSPTLPALPTRMPTIVQPNVPATPVGSDLVGPLNMPGDSLDSVLALIERWSGKTLLRPQNLPQATLTINLREQVTKKEAIQALETLLNINNIALTPLGERFIKVTALNAAKSEAPELIEGSTLELPPSGHTASKIFSLQFLRVAEFMPQIAGLLNPNAGSPPVIFDKANAALITDSVSNLQRVETLVAKLDQPSLAGLTPKFYQISHGAKASDVVNKLKTVLSGPLAAQLGTSTTYMPDDRTNQITLIADPRQYAFFDELVAKLDVKSDPNTRNEVIQLKHANSKDVATILTQLITGQNNAAKTSGQENISRTPQNPGTPGAPAAPATPAAVLATLAIQGTGVESSANQFSTLLTILPDDRTNAIVVSGTVDDMRLVNELVAKIDVLLAQVRIEIVMAEVNLKDEATSGIDALGLQVTDGRLTGISGSVAGATLGGSAVAASGTTPASSNGFATLAGGLSGIINVKTTPRKSNTTILSEPTITTTHNKEATIFVGQTRPTISSSTSSNASVGAANPYTTSSITQQEVGITITVKPLIGNDGSVQLDLTLESSALGDAVTIDGNVQNAILKRKTKSFVTAKSGEILVLGGLQQKSNIKSTSRLGAIPFLGDLLGTRSRSDIRTELIFFLRPVVLTNTPADNAPALNEVDQFPKKPRAEAQRALGVQPSP